MTLWPAYLSIAAIALIAIFLGWALWTRDRGQHIDVPHPQFDTLESFLGAMAALTQGWVIEGNEVEILQDSAFFDAILAEIAAAQETIHLESFLWWDGHISDRFIAALSARAQAGVVVRVLVDARGALKMSNESGRRLEKAGVDFRRFRRAHPLTIGSYELRDHRKVAVIDGTSGYVFGHGIADPWYQGPPDARKWRDTAARLRGPVVNQLQGIFFENWTESAGRIEARAADFPKLERAGSTTVHLAWHGPSGTISAARILYYLAIAAARREVLIQNPYFIPDRTTTQLLTEAVGRGVRIRILLPQAGESDFPVVQHGTHRYYPQLVKAGIEVSEMIVQGLHQKVMVVDREWSCIGSTNFDPRSFHLNDEISVGIHDRAIAEELAEAFERDIEQSMEWTEERLRARSLLHRIRDRLSVLVKPEL